MTYTYDGAGRLMSESSTNGNITYGYDARGNRTSMTRGSTTTTYAYDLNNRLSSETTGTTVKNYTYDVDGNTLTAGNESYTYDVRNRQIGYTDGTTTASYVYNPKGLRSQKTVGGATKYFVWDGMNIVYEYDASAGTAYYYGLYRVSAGNSQFYLYNAHGDVVQLTDGTGAVTKSYAYDAFGNEVNPSANDTNPFRYCGEYYDVETGTIYLRARYYDPTTGRFTQQDAWAYFDASDPLGLNLYTYCLNNPILYRDPNGNIAVVTAVILVDGGALISGIIDAGIQLYHNGGKFDELNWRSIGASAVSGGVTSGLALATGGLSLSFNATVASGALIGGIGYGTYHLVNGSDTNALGWASAVVSGGFSSGLSYRISHKIYHQDWLKSENYAGIYDPSQDFVKGKKLIKHYKQHAKDFGLDPQNPSIINVEKYVQEARNFLLKPVTATTQTFTSSDGYYFRYDIATNEFGIMSNYGGISTYFKPDRGINYWIDQIQQWFN